MRYPVARKNRRYSGGERAAPSSATEGVHHKQADRGVGASATRRRSGRGDPGPGARAREGATVQGTVVTDPPSPNRGWVRSFAKKGTRLSRTHTPLLAWLLAGFGVGAAIAMSACLLYVVPEWHASIGGAILALSLACIFLIPLAISTGGVVLGVVGSALGIGFRPAGWA